MAKKSLNKELVNKTRLNLRTMYINKYYNLFMNSFEWTGLDKRQKNYVMRQFWDKGTVAAFKIKLIDELGFAPYTVQAWDMYDFATRVRLINKRGVPFIPTRVQAVDKDVVIGFAQCNQKSVKEICYFYIDRMVAIDMVINTNLTVHKLPFIVKCNPEDMKKFEDLMARVLNDETVIYTDLQQVLETAAINLTAPYIIDKLYAYRIALENELMSYLGIDNAGTSAKATTETLDEVNANNVLINLCQDQFLTNIKEFTESISEVLKIQISVKLKAPKAEETYESRNRSDAYQERDDKPSQEENQDESN